MHLYAISSKHPNSKEKTLSLIQYNGKLLLSSLLSTLMEKPVLGHILRTSSRGFNHTFWRERRRGRIRTRTTRSTRTELHLKNSLVFPVEAEVVDKYHIFQ